MNKAFLHLLKNEIGDSLSAEYVERRFGLIDVEGSEERLSVTDTTGVVISGPADKVARALTGHWQSTAPKEARAETSDEPGSASSAVDDFIARVNAANGHEPPLEKSGNAVDDFIAELNRQA